jgi:hypothetical protein
MDEAELCTMVAFIIEGKIRLVSSRLIRKILFPIRHANQSKNKATHKFCMICPGFWMFPIWDPKFM